MTTERLHAQKKTRHFKERNEEARTAFAQKIALLPTEAICYVDETGVDEYFHRDRCRAKRGVKIYDGISGRKYIRRNLVAAQVCDTLIAPLECSGTTDHFVFEAWFEKMLLKELPKGTTIVMDNASFHRKETLRKLAQQAKCEVWFLPAYSPDLNPIELSWADLKRFLRNYASCYFLF